MAVYVVVGVIAAIAVTLLIMDPDYSDPRVIIALCSAFLIMAGLTAMVSTYVFYGFVSVLIGAALGAVVYYYPSDKTSTAVANV